jgi:phage terminase small subunit
MASERSEYDALNERQRRFVEEYLKDPNGTQAAIRAGYSSKTARQAGARLLAHVDIRVAIARSREERAERTKIDADFVLIKAAALCEANILDFCEVLPDGSLKPTMKDVTREKAAAIVEFKHKKLLSGEVEITLKLVDPIRSLELLGKHTDVRAFLERHSIEDGDDLARALQQAEARVREGRKGNEGGRLGAEPSSSTRENRP